MRRINLYYRCVERSTFLDINVKNKIATTVEKYEEEEGEGEDDQSLEEGQQDNSGDPVTSSLQDITGGSLGGSVKIRGLLNEKPILILLDS